MSKGKLLVVDDDPTQRRMFWRYFGERGYAVSQASSSDEARRLLAETHHDLILLDLVLKSDRCGIELLKCLKKTLDFAAIPVIAMTGHNSAHPILVEALELGAVEGVTKPMALGLLELKIARLIAKFRRAKVADESEQVAEPKQERPRARARVLVVEDEDQYQDLYRSFFKDVYTSEFIYVPAVTARAALNVLERHPAPPIDIALIDWNLPDMEGLRLLRLLRKDPRTRRIFTLMVTAHTSGNDAGTALDRGMDDYLRKPWAERELLGRLHALLRRREQVYEAQGGYKLDGLALAPIAGKAALNGDTLDLTPTEFALLKLLLERPDMAHGQDYLRDALAQESASVSPDTFRKHLSNLRAKLGPWGERIEAVRGRGYVLHTRYPALPG